MTHSRSLSTSLTGAAFFFERARGALWRSLPGLVLSAVLAAGGMVLGSLRWLQHFGLSALTLAILLGMVLGNTVYPRVAVTCGAGVQVSKQNLLRLGIVLYGFRLTLQDIGRVGMAGVLIDTLVLCSSFGLAYLLGTRWLKLDPKTTMLIGAGSSICGAAAVMATEPVLRARAEQVSVAVATVVVFGTLSIFLYPVLFELNQHWHVLADGGNGFGMYIGSTVHEVAQVVAAAQMVGAQAQDTAVITKMVRVMMLAPFLLMLSAWVARNRAKRHPDQHHTVGTAEKSTITLPWFALAFVAVVAFNSLHWLPTSVIEVMTTIDTMALAMAMAALGLATQVSAVRQAGIKPLLLAWILFGWLVVGGALINRCVVDWVY
nr:YeiH family protein [uncultured Rhodoferax sp.]